jgi:hypothetical protein
VTDGVLATWDTFALGDGEYTLRLVASDQKREFSDRVLLWKDAALRSGWPVDMEGPVYSSAALADLDGVAGEEAVLGVPVVASQNPTGRYHALTGAGGSAPGAWPADVPHPVANSPAVGDLDLDGYPEVVATSFGFRQLHAWRADGTPLAGFPVDVSSGYYVRHGGGFMSDVSPVLANLDADPDLEILLASLGKVWALNRDGSNVPGWPVELVAPQLLRDSAAVAVGDLDRDGLPEVVAYYQVEESTYPYVKHTYVHVLTHDGTPMETGSWPLHSEEISGLSSPTLGDLDADGDLEILIGGRPRTNQTTTGFVHAWHHEVGYEVLTDPVLANIDADPNPEVLVASTAHRVYAFEPDGTKRLELSATVGGTPHPVVGDVDGDGAVEIVVGGFYGDLNAWHADGTPVTGWPRKTRDLISTSAGIGDVNGDGLIDVVVGSKDWRAYAWDLAVPIDAAKMEWPTYRRTTSRIGRYVPPQAPCSGSPGEVFGLALEPGAATRLSWDCQGPGILYDVAGWLVSDLRRDGGTAGASCLDNDLPDLLWGDLRSAPSPGEGYYYLVRANNGCGNGTYGSTSGGVERLPGADCP